MNTIYTIFKKATYFFEQEKNLCSFHDIKCSLTANEKFRKKAIKFSISF